ncbi:MAG: cytochrome bd ubiquinol oxidase subunit [Solirubrobacteraceae bacterium]|nr:cytochrome bd ubiquinol oxidase subunit [Solirubrobacteraceae bacterium]
MHLYEIPLIFVLIGLALYVVLAGADFGAGFWQLLAGAGRMGERIRDHAHEAMAPVWEANHVWLIFVITVTWTAYPTAFASIASTLSVPLFIAAVGIIMRGASYALRAGTETAAERRRVDLVFALSSVLTPFALGTIVGGIASQRVPVGNAAGDMFSSWLNPTSIMVGVLAVANSAYLAAVFLAADARRVSGEGSDDDLLAALRVRALVTGLVSGAEAIAALILVRSDAHFLYTRLLHGSALAAVIVSAVAGLATLELVRRSSFEAARYTAALAVAAVLAGWALAQRPLLLEGLTVQQAAAPHDTLVVVVISVIAGATILFPSLALLFRLVLQGRLDHGEPDAGGSAAAAAGRSELGRLLAASAQGLLARAAGACLLAGFGFLTVAEAGWAHAIGVAALFGFLICGFLAVVPAQLADFAGEERSHGADGTR